MLPPATPHKKYAHDPASYAATPPAQLIKKFASHALVSRFCLTRSS
ncbi:hypothetical protein GA0070560_10514 [Micromonospora halophytica]|uniref:Uncharacterized protein n=1 Tax=Micromonospora halophytica TaxID=47864 RepID=A0A1C5HLD3_9ACTN|nr:hypothetical protein GA0070560_10514 [Micromonospora halophytica]